MTYDATSGDIVWNLMASLANHLQEKLVDDVPPEYEGLLSYVGEDGVERVFKPSLVKVGRLQENPTNLSEDSYEPSCYVSIHSNDPDDLSDGWKHTLAGAVESSTSNLGYALGRPFGLEGETVWQRRVKVEMASFFLLSDQSQSEASRVANALRMLIERYAEARTQVNPHGWEVWAVSDVSGEKARDAIVAKAHMAESGGPPANYIWRGSVWVQVLTVRE